MARKKTAQADGNGQPAETNGTAVVDNPSGSTPGSSNGNGEERRQPFHKIRMRNISAAIWQNRSQEGQYWYGVTITRSYRDQNQNWHTTDSFSGPDLLIVAEVARAAFAWIIATTQSPNNAVQAAAKDAQPVNGEEIPF